MGTWLRAAGRGGASGTKRSAARRGRAGWPCAATCLLHYMRECLALPAPNLGSVPWPARGLSGCKLRSPAHAQGALSAASHAARCFPPDTQIRVALPPGRILLTVCPGCTSRACFWACRSAALALRYLEPRPVHNTVRLCMQQAPSMQANRDSRRWTCSDHPVRWLWGPALATKHAVHMKHARDMPLDTSGTASSLGGT